MNQLSKPVDFDAGSRAPPIGARGPSPEAVKMRDAIPALTPLLRETTDGSAVDTIVEINGRDMFGLRPFPMMTPLTPSSGPPPAPPKA